MKTKKATKNKVKLTSTDKVVFIVIGLLALFWLALVIMGYNQNPNTDKLNTIGYYHNMGDAIGGISAPFIGLISALLIYITIKQQIRANEIIVNTRREDNLAQNLKNYKERMEDKYEALVDDYNPLDIESSLTTIKQIIMVILSSNAPPDPLPSNYLPYGSTADYVMAVADLKRRINFLIDTLSIFRYAVFFQQYLTKYYLDEEISPEAKELISITMHELSSFVGSKLEKGCEVAKTLPEVDPYEFPYGREIRDITESARLIYRMRGDFEVIDAFEEYFTR